MLDWIVNGVVLVVCFIVAFFFLKRRDEEAARKEREKALAAAAKDEEKVIEKPYSLNELREYDGTDDNKPLLLAVNYKVFDVTKGKDFYGKGGSYEALAGRDASRALATMDLSEKAVSDEWDELSDLGGEEWGTLKDWEQNFTMKYKCVGWLEKEPGRNPTEDKAVDQPVDKEVESVGSDQKVDTVTKVLEDGAHQTGGQGDESQPCETQPIEETEHVEDVINDQTTHGNDQTEDNRAKVDRDQKEDQDDPIGQDNPMGQDDRNQHQDKVGQVDNEDQTNHDDQSQHQNQTSQSLEKDSRDPVEANQDNGDQ